MYALNSHSTVKPAVNETNSRLGHFIVTSIGRWSLNAGQNYYLVQPLWGHQWGGLLIQVGLWIQEVFDAGFTACILEFA